MSLIIIDQVFVDEKFSKSTLRKQSNSDLVPAVGMELEDAAWEKAKKIKKVNINIDKNYYMLFVEDEFMTKSTSAKIIDGFKKHGWKEIGG
jgi:hypothetical protein